MQHEQWLFGDEQYTVPVLKAIDELLQYRPPRIRGVFARFSAQKPEWNGVHSRRFCAIFSAKTRVERRSPHSRSEFSMGERKLLFTPSIGRE